MHILFILWYDNDIRKDRGRYATEDILKYILLPIIMIILICGATGCGDTDKQEAAVKTATETPQPAITSSPAAMVSPEPVATTPPEPVATVSPAPTVTEKPAPTEDPTMVKIANGFYYIALDDDIKARITGMSYPADGADCAISYDDLRYIHLLHYNFDGNIKDGELIVNARIADEVLEIFYELYQAEYPLASVVLVDDFGEPGDDNLSMAANNTSAFNYRYVTGTSKLSRHSYGAAIDINPVFNPYIDGDRIVPENGIMYADRRLDLPGMIDHDDLCYQLFTQHGWTWGGDWSGDKDYQHFSKDLGY